jgi:hypothetical protein
MSKCDSCDIDLPGDHLVVLGKPFCCHGCSQGGPCICTYEMENSRQGRNGHSDPLILDMLLGDPDMDSGQNHPWPMPGDPA